MFTLLGGHVPKKVLKTGEIFNMFNVFNPVGKYGKEIEHGTFPHRIEHIEHFPCFRHSLKAPISKSA